MVTEYFNDFADDTAYHFINSSLSSCKALPFYIESIGKCTQNDKFWTKRSDKNSFMVLLTVSGEGLITYDGKTKQLKAGHMCFLDTLESHFYCTKSGSSWEHYWILLNGDGCRKYFNLIHGLSTVNLGKNYNLVVTAIRHIEQCIVNPTMKDNVRISFYIDEILSLFLEGSLTDQDKTVYQWNKARDIAIYIHSNLHRKIYLEELSDLICVSKETFHAKFKEEFGKTLSEYILAERIKSAAELLVNSDFTIEYIASLLSYSNPGRFIQKFKLSTGLTPAQYRAMNRSDTK